MDQRNNFPIILEMDLIPWGVTFIVSLLVGLEFGILCGFIISVIFLLYYAARPRVRVKWGQVRLIYRTKYRKGEIHVL